MSAEYGEALKGIGTRSAGLTEICFDNTMVESFFGFLKNERVSRDSYPTREESQRDIIRHIEFCHNPQRFHSALGYRPPREAYVEFENLRLAA
ncbi:IS3 family transposase [Streptomyces xinghaiensis]|uniref:IS3 family transposase n=1 Tax=Streptomyces xinghaiensis TaxID=1038928 RepID=UPI00378F6743